MSQEDMNNTSVDMEEMEMEESPVVEERKPENQTANNKKPVCEVMPVVKGNMEDDTISHGFARLDVNTGEAAIGFSLPENTKLEIGNDAGNFNLPEYSTGPGIDKKPKKAVLEITGDYLSLPISLGKAKLKYITGKVNPSHPILRRKLAQPAQCIQPGKPYYTTSGPLALCSYPFVMDPTEAACGPLQVATHVATWIAPEETDESILCDPTPLATLEESALETTEANPEETPMVTPVETPEETHVANPDETPLETPEETDVANPEETLVATSMETPEETPLVTPAATSGKGPRTRIIAFGGRDLGGVEFLSEITFRKVKQLRNEPTKGPRKGIQHTNVKVGPKNLNT